MRKNWNYWKNIDLINKILNWMRKKMLNWNILNIFIYIFRRYIEVMVIICLHWTLKMISVVWWAIQCFKCPQMAWVAIQLKIITSSSKPPPRIQMWIRTIHTLCHKCRPSLCPHLIQPKCRICWTRAKVSWNQSLKLIVLADRPILIEL